MRHLIDIEDLTDREVELVLDLTSRMQIRPASYMMRGKVVANLFYEPSTRTAASFHIAATRLGAAVYSVQDVVFSSIAKGETLEDTIRVIGGYVDAIVLRHPDGDAAERASFVSPVPVINAGCGTAQHPTQALLDLYTIRTRCGLDHPLNVGFMGDLRNSRTVHSLSRLLRRYQGIRQYFFSLPGLGMPEAEPCGITDENDKLIEDAIGDLDVLYVTRVQKERMPVGNWGAAPAKVTLDLLRRAKKNLVVMHPLPRTEELPVEVDADPRAAYFEQAQNGLYVRMAVLHMAMRAG